MIEKLVFYEDYEDDWNELSEQFEKLRRSIIDYASKIYLEGYFQSRIKIEDKETDFENFWHISREILVSLIMEINYEDLDKENTERNRIVEALEED